MSKKATLLLNLGSPDSPSTHDIKRYLKEFLMDRRILDMSLLKRWLLVNFLILPRRSSKTAKAYKRIWTDEGSPLISGTRKLGNRISQDSDIHIEVAMRYGNPSTPDAIKNLKRQGIEELFIIPLFPHYSVSSYESAIAWAHKNIQLHAPEIKTTCLDPFYKHPEYINALYKTTEPFLKSEYDKILFSFHGLPQNHLRLADPTKQHCLTSENCCKNASPAHATCYRHQCLETAKLLTAQAQIPKEKYAISFQSRLGREPWLKPYTEQILKDLPEQGAKKILVISPAFVSDNLETLEELAISGKKTFMQAGGKEFRLIPCLNQNESWIDFLQNRISEWLLSHQT